MKTVIVSLHDDNYQAMADVVTPNFQEYADKWGYDLKIYDKPLDSSRHTYWSKVLAVQEQLETYDRVFWCDIDSVFVDFTCPLIDQLSAKIDISRWDHKNTIGIINNMERPAKDATECFFSVSQMLWIIEEDERAIKFLDQAYKKTEYLGHIWPEQMAIIKTREERPDEVLSDCFVKIINPIEYMSRPQGFGGYPIATLCGGTGVLNQKISCLKKMLGYVKKS